jgi:hypothetical protein
VLDLTYLGLVDARTGGVKLCIINTTSTVAQRQKNTTAVPLAGWPESGLTDHVSLAGQLGAESAHALKLDLIRDHDLQILI